MRFIIGVQCGWVHWPHLEQVLTRYGEFLPDEFEIYPVPLSLTPSPDMTTRAQMASKCMVRLWPDLKATCYIGVGCRHCSGLYFLEAIGHDHQGNEQVLLEGNVDPYRLFLEVQATNPFMAYYKLAHKLRNNQPRDFEQTERLKQHLGIP